MQIPSSSSISSAPIPTNEVEADRKSSSLVMYQYDGPPVARYHLDSAQQKSPSNPLDMFGAPPDLSRSTVDLSK